MSPGSGFPRSRTSSSNEAMMVSSAIWSAGDSLATLKRRRIVRSEMIDSLLDTHLASHAGYYGTLVWVLMMLELWFQHHVDRNA